MLHVCLSYMHLLLVQPDVLLPKHNVALTHESRFACNGVITSRGGMAPIFVNIHPVCFKMKICE